MILTESPPHAGEEVRLGTVTTMMDDSGTAGAAPAHRARGYTETRSDTTVSIPAGAAGEGAVEAGGRDASLAGMRSRRAVAVHYSPSPTSSSVSAADQAKSSRRPPTDERWIC